MTLETVHTEEPWFPEHPPDDLFDVPGRESPVEPRPWLLDAADLLAQPDPGPTAWLVNDLIVEGAIVAAVGRWKTTKSYGLLDVCISIATGEPAFGILEIPQPGTVVFVNEESGKAALWRRLDSLCRGRAIDPERLRGRLHVAANARVALDDPKWQLELIAVGKELQPRLYVFDPLARMKAAAREERDQSQMAPLIDFLRQLRDETGSTVSFVHHQGHTGTHMRGSSDLESAWETRLLWKRDGQSPTVKIESEHREAEASEPLEYRIAWDPDTRSIRFNATAPAEEHDLPDLEQRITEWLTEHPDSKARDIAKGIQVRAADVDRTLDEMTHTGDVTKGRSGRRDKLGRPVKDTVYNTQCASSQTPFPDTPGTSHGTSHRTSSQPPDEPGRATVENGANPVIEPEVARPANGTNQDAPQAGHRAPVGRPVSIRDGRRDEAPDEPPTVDDDIPF